MNWAFPVQYDHAMPRNKMTDRELAFCEAYATCRSAERAALKAGYSPTNARKNAWQILNRPHVQEYLNVLSERARDSSVVSLAEVIESEDPYWAVPVKDDRVGDPRRYRETAVKVGDKFGIRLTSIVLPDERPIWNFSLVHIQSHPHLKFSRNFPG